MFPVPLWQACPTLVFKYRGWYLHLSSCTDTNQLESPEHILLTCPAYTTTRNNMFNMCMNVSNPISFQLVSTIFSSGSHTKIMQFLLDCSPLPEVVSCAQMYGEDIYSDLFYLSRTWCFSIHKERMKRLGKWNFR